MSQQPFKDLFIRIECPNFTDEVFVLKEIRKKLSEYKCKMKECGEMKDLEKVLFKKFTGASKGSSLPPKYVKIGFEDDKD